ncbi:hypothetical protein P691DRAFT_776332 [Macrolepiota fuliginosa MF-IS2]|uniref:Uncharacterized protein n=1 Tax=Macrolepiota fuliginosa MF-IS2 TaxID=1400762 RepID=A0A9P5X9F7_9AGAR|nr:hypothetical protein P691DRAFT_776332 [Macrolepiota fuliginosa MF-IS2]
MSSQDTSPHPPPTPGNLAPAPSEILPRLERLIAQEAHRWGTKAIQKKLWVDILDPLTSKIRADTQDEKTYKDNTSVLKSLSSNPDHLHNFAKCVIDGSYIDNTFRVISLSGINTTTTFARLGIKILDDYRICEVLKIIRSSDFKKHHDYHFPILNEHVVQLNEAIVKKRRHYVGDSEDVARVMINAYFDALADHLPSVARLEFCLARITAKLRAIEVDYADGANIHHTYLTGVVDYALLSIIHYDTGLPGCYLGNVNETIGLLQGLELGSFQGTYQGLADYLAEGMTEISRALDWDILFIEAKCRGWFSPIGTVSPASLYQAIATCCAAQTCGRDGRRVIKLCLSSGDHWVFIIVNNDTSRAYVTQVLNNSDLDRTEDALLLKAFWMVIPGQILEEHIFGKIKREAKAKASPSTDDSHPLP